MYSWVRNMLSIWWVSISTIVFSSFMQDLFTISLGWFIFGGLPFDLVSSLFLFLWLAVIYCLLIVVDGYLLSVECPWTASGICWLWSLCLLQTHGKVIIKYECSYDLSRRVIICTIFLPLFLFRQLCDTRRDKHRGCRSASLT